MEKLIENIEKWFEDRCLLKTENIEAQYKKLKSEVDELGEAILNGNEEEYQDAIGDIFVVLVGLSKIKNYPIKGCIVDSFNIINKRQGITVDGTYIKREDLEKLPVSVCKELIQKATFNNLVNFP